MNHLTALELESCWLLVPNLDIETLILSDNQQALSQVQYQNIWFPVYDLNNFLNLTNQPDTVSMGHEQSKYQCLICAREPSSHQANNLETAIAIPCLQVKAIASTMIAHLHWFEVPAWTMPAPRLANKMCFLSDKLIGPNHSDKPAFLTSGKSLIQWLDAQFEINTASVDIMQAPLKKQA